MQWCCGQVWKETCHEQNITVNHILSLGHAMFNFSQVKGGWARGQETRKRGKKYIHKRKICATQRAKRGDQSHWDSLVLLDTVSLINGTWMYLWVSSFHTCRKQESKPARGRERERCLHLYHLTVQGSIQPCYLIAFVGEQENKRKREKKSVGERASSK